MYYFIFRNNKLKVKNFKWLLDNCPKCSLQQTFRGTYYVPCRELDARDSEARKKGKNLWLNLAPKDTEKDNKATTKATTPEMDTSSVARFWTVSPLLTGPVDYSEDHHSGFH